MQTSGNNHKNKVVFFGSGPVAKKSLQLLAQNFEIEAVITKPSTLKDMQSLNLGNQPSFYAISNKTELDNLFDRQNFKSKLAVLVDFGIIVSQKLIDSFKLGIINSHFSLLPEWRGADPITFSILSGQKQTGVSLMLLVEAMDEGPLLAVGEYELDIDITTPKLTEDLINLSDSLLKNTIPNYINVEIQAVEQSQVADLMNYSNKPSYSRKLIKQDGILDFAKPADRLEREVRAFIEWPKSRTTILGQDVIVIEAKVLDKQIELGQVLTDDRQIIIGCQKYALEVIKLKPAGKKEMTAQAFLLGYLKK